MDLMRRVLLLDQLYHFGPLKPFKYEDIHVSRLHVTYYERTRIAFMDWETNVIIIRISHIGSYKNNSSSI